MVSFAKYFSFLVCSYLLLDYLLNSCMFLSNPKVVQESMPESKTETEESAPELEAKPN